jgi:hypothetical protein
MEINLRNCALKHKSKVKKVFMDTLPKIINQYPELLEITRPQLKSVLYTQLSYCPHFVDSLIQIYKFFFEIEPVVFVPKYFPDSHQESIIADLENLQNVKSNGVVIFAYADIVFNEVQKLTRRRINTILKSILKTSKVIILSITDLKSLQIPVLETFTTFNKTGLKSLKNLSFFDLVDNDESTFNENMDSFIEMVNLFNGKKVYISLCLPTKQLLEIETRLKLTNRVYRKEPAHGDEFVVINSCKTTQKTLLKNDYDVFIYSLPEDLEGLDFISYMKDSFKGQPEIYTDSINTEYITNINFKGLKRVIPQDSKELFDSPESIKIENIIFASEEYHRFNSPESIQKMDLRNLTKKDYDVIRNFIKQRLISKFDLDIKTCQLSTPSSPKDRSRKLNSLSNKISSTDYRCHVTCEIFKDYSIGVVLWNETFSSRESINCLENETYVYQTTSGKWRYTTIN